MQYSTAIRNARLAADETTVSTAPKLQLWSGSIPANCAAVDAGDGAKLVEIDCPADWQGAPANGVADKAGTWSGVGLAAAGTGTNITHFRFKDAAGTTCHMQGTVGTSGADLIVDNVSVAVDQVVTVSKFERTVRTRVTTHQTWGKK